MQTGFNVSNKPPAQDNAAGNEMPDAALPQAVKIEYLADRPEFVSTLATWHRREWGYLRPDETLEIRTARIRERAGRRQVPTVLVASDGDILLGAAMLVKHDMESRLRLFPWLAGVVVAPEHRRRGIGASLVERAVSEARALGFPMLYLYTFGDGRYYTRLGWRFIERSTYLGGNVAIMSFALQ